MKGKQTEKSPRRAVPSKQKSQGETVLLAVTGMSPAILTETIWALARETPPVIPDRVVVITTSRGQENMQSLFKQSPELGNKCAYDCLCEFLATKHVVTNKLRYEELILRIWDEETRRYRNLPDIRTKTENDAAANFIMKQVLALAADPTDRIVGTIAGGRKTMGALLYACMSILGRPTDRLTHVLIEEPYETGLQPESKFFFPDQPNQELKTRQGGTVAASDARVELATVPFVPLRKFLHEQVGSVGGRFTDFVAGIGAAIDEITGMVEVLFDDITGVASIDGVKVSLNGRDWAFFAFVCQRATEGLSPFLNHPEVEQPFAEFLKIWAEKHPAVTLEYGSTNWRNKPPEADDFRKRLNALRDELKDNELGRVVAILFPQRGPVGFAKERVQVTMEPAKQAAGDAFRKRLRRQARQV